MAEDQRQESVETTREKRERFDPRRHQVIYLGQLADAFPNQNGLNSNTGRGLREVPK